MADGQGEDELVLDPSLLIEEPERIVAGTRIGRYELAYEIASGGMATVYLARQHGEEGFAKLVALKRIHPHLAKQQQFVEMFLDEARIASRIGHPNVAAVFDFGRAEDGSYYIAMEYLMGEPLGRFVHALRKKLSREALFTSAPYVSARVIAEACEGLHAAHELVDESGMPLGVVHRDVSPHNLFITYEGNVKVVDFGIAKAATKLHHTATGTLKGKVAYMAPEQMRSRVPVDRRADVWALGVCLWEMVTHKRLFRRELDTDTMFAVMEDPIPRPSEIRPELPAALDAIVMRALERDREARYVTAREMGRALSRLVTDAGQTVGAPELAELMSELFAEQRQKRLDLADDARTVVSSTIPKLPPGLAHDDPSRSQSVAVAPLAATVRERRSRAPLIAAIALVLAACTAGGMAAVMSLLPSEATPARFAVRGESVVPLEESVPLAAEPALAALETGGEGIAPAPVAPSEPANAPEAVVPPSLPDEPSEPAGMREDDVERPTELAEAEPSPTRGPNPAQPPRTRTREASRPETPGPALASAPEPAARTSTGATLIVDTQGGWADVFVDGRPVGRSPLRAPISPGAHTIRLLPMGEEPAHSQRVMAFRGAEVRVALRIGYEQR